MHKISFASLLALVCACGNDNGGAAADAGASDTPGGCAVEANLTSLHANLFSTTRCAIPGCHASSNPGGSLNFSANKDAVHQALLEGGTFNTAAQGQFPDRVVMNDPDMSYLYEKVSKTSPVGGMSGRMPPGLPLQDCEIQAIRGWIEAGAPND
jgi:hypothetical protein